MDDHDHSADAPTFHGKVHGLATPLALDFPGFQDQLSRAAHLATVGEMLSGIAHEINQPLTAITTLAGALRRTIGDQGTAATQAQEIADAIAAQALRAAKVVHRVRTLVKQANLNLQATAVNDTVRELMNLAEPIAKARGVTISVELAHQLPLVRADGTYLQLLLLNLIQNSAEAIEAHQSLDRRIAIRTSARPPQEVEIAVEDTGGGIAPEIRATLFRPFNTTKPQGVGLGLLACQRIAQVHGGRLSAENSQGAGARFSLVLPAWTGTAGTTESLDPR
jgi:two-component system, LuxR family, sensor kinase FixL